MMKRRFVSILLVLSMLLVWVPIDVVAEQAADGIEKSTVSLTSGVEVLGMCYASSSPVNEVPDYCGKVSNDGLYLARYGSYLGLIDITGKWIAPPKYVEIGYNYEGKYGLDNGTSNPYDYTNYVPVYFDTLNENQEIEQFLYEPWYFYAAPVNCGIGWDNTNKCFNYICAQSNLYEINYSFKGTVGVNSMRVVSEHEIIYEGADWNTENMRYYHYSIDSPYMAIATDGELKTGFVFEDIRAYSDGLIAVKQDGKWGYADKEGNVVIPCKYEAVRHNALWRTIDGANQYWNLNDWAAYEIEQKAFAESYTDGYITTAQYTQTFPADCTNGYVVVFDGNSYALFDNAGNKVIPFGVYEALTEVYDGKLWAKKDGIWSVLDLDYYNYFDQYVYRTDLLLDVAEAEECGLSLDDYVSYVNYYSPSQIYLASGELDSMNDLWKGITESINAAKDLGKVVDYHFEQDDVYTSIILAALGDVVENGMINSEAEKIIKKAKEWANAVKKAMYIECGIDLTAREDYLNMTYEQKIAFQNKLKDQITRNPLEGYVEYINEAYKYLGEFLDLADCVDTFFSNFASYLSLWHVSDTMVVVLDEMNAQTSDIYMSAALSFCSDAIESTAAEFISDMLQKAVVTSAGKYAVSKTISFFWERAVDAVCISSPAVGVLLAVYEVSMTISNNVFGAKEISEATYKMSAIKEYYSVLNDAVYELVDDYMNSETADNARAVIDSLSLMFALSYEDCDVAKKFVEAVEKPIASKVNNWLAKHLGIGKYTDYEEALGYIESTRESFGSKESEYKTHWIYHLENDYPELYYDYCELIGENKPLVVLITKSYEIACPVNVYVYDSENNLVAYAEDKYVYAEGNVLISRDGDKKIVDILDNEEYRIVCDGYGEGEMDVNINQYLDGVETRMGTFCNLPVSSETKHEIITVSDAEDVSEYVISTADKDILADYDSKNDASKYVLSIEGGFMPTDNGIEVEASASAGQQIEVSAYVPDGYEFVRWEFSGANNYVDDLYAQTTIVHMPASNASIKAVFEKKPPFQDVEKGKFYYNAVLWAVDNGITAGTTKTTFSPDGDCTRAQVVTFLWRAAGKPEPGITEHPFTDVNPRGFYYKAMLWAVENGITAGTTKTTFSPEETCTRGQVVTFLWRASGKPAATTTAHSFTDVRNGAFYYKAMLWAVENKITVGVTKTTFKPEDTCTRGQVVTFLYRSFG